ncbi:MAG: hypothetical protein ABJJ07_06755, partial [Maribacter dokdonensis]
LCIDPSTFKDTEIQEKLLNEIIGFAHDSSPISKGGRTYYPGERTLKQRSKSIKEGMQVNTVIWKKILELIA